MKKLILVCFLMATLALAAGCSREDSLLNSPSPGQNDGMSVMADPENVAKELISLFNWETDPAQAEGLQAFLPAEGVIVDFSRNELPGGIAHYKATVQIGPGPYDLIGLHRVVKERKPYFPMRTTKTVFLQHGDAVAFEGMFLHGVLSASAPVEHSFAIYLASNDVDVWGIDQSWAFIPPGTADLSFMAGWGLQDHVDKLDLAISVARICRRFCGGGMDRMHLLGYSSGGWIGYSLLNMETLKPFVSRNIRGFIPVDVIFKTDDPVEAATFQAFAAEYQGLYDMGVYHWDVYFAPIGYLALTDPDGVSPLAPPFTNMQTALAYGSATHLFAPLTPWFHYFAGIFDETTQMPTGLQFVSTPEFIEFLLTANYYEASLFSAEMFHITGGAVDLPFDDHLADVTVPVMSVAAAGGMGHLAAYSTTLLGSTDITTMVAGLYPPEYILADFGHVDIFIAGNAEAMVWQPILGWIVNHSQKEGLGENFTKN